MMRHWSTLLIILIACASYSLGVLISYPHNSVVNFSPGENISLTCSGLEEVQWEVDSPPLGVYSVRVETPKRKILEIVNATTDNTGVYKCYPIKRKVEFSKIYLSAVSVRPEKSENNATTSAPPSTVRPEKSENNGTAPEPSKVN
ncbi:uncharacterized protein LOC135834928 [Planococcus citri]|uniref:uncharacterized protein LOC135834928 n=1 Tax=Planococcus citri TaxID=170843 RepID=UPI0031F7B045